MKKVIRGLEICSELGSWHGRDCEFNGAYKDCPYRGCETGCVVTIAKDALVLLKEQPEIVRCKDCNKRGQSVYRADGAEYIVCWNQGLGIQHPIDWFCADGERRDNDA